MGQRTKKKANQKKPKAGDPTGRATKQKGERDAGRRAEGQPGPNNGGRGEKRAKAKGGRKGEKAKPKGGEATTGAGPPAEKRPRQRKKARRDRAGIAEEGRSGKKKGAAGRGERSGGPKAGKREKENADATPRNGEEERRSTRINPRRGDSPRKKQEGEAGFCKFFSQCLSGAGKKGPKGLPRGSNPEEGTGSQGGREGGKTEGGPRKDQNAWRGH